MFKRISLFLTVALVTLSATVYAEAYKNIGRTATKQEILAWDIDVRPDFKGLPPGAGSVEEGEELWEEKCASCHGVFGESNEVFTPIVGGVTEEDVKSGRVASLVGNKQPQKTTVMKVATVSTLWDYINRAMPWTAPKSLTPNEVYAATAYILSLARIIPDDFILTNKNISDVQKLMPNRNGMTLKHGLRQVDGKPDMKSDACMNNCKIVGKVTSVFPVSARNSHGNIRLQNRTFGAVRGIDTTKPPAKSLKESISNQKQTALSKSKDDSNAEKEMLALAKKHNCLTCHGIKNKIVGPGFNEVAAKYKSVNSINIELEKKVKKGTSGAWGDVPMPAQTTVSDADVKALINWILKGS